MGHSRGPVSEAPKGMRLTPGPNQQKARHVNATKEPDPTGLNCSESPNSSAVRRLARKHSSAKMIRRMLEAATGEHTEKNIQRVGKSARELLTELERGGVLARPHKNADPLKVEPAYMPAIQMKSFTLVLPHPPTGNMVSRSRSGARPYLNPVHREYRTRTGARGPSAGPWPSMRSFTRRGGWISTTLIRRFMTRSKDT